jgi:signal transduction histidine kinase
MAKVRHRPGKRTNAIVGEDTQFARLVSLACHDIRTPLATVHGFAKTLSRHGELDEAATRYVEMIEAAAQQVSALVDELALVARIEAGAYEPTLAAVDSRTLVDEATVDLDPDTVSVRGTGATVRVDVEAVRRALEQLVRATRRHGGLERVDVSVDGPAVVIGPLTEFSRPVVLGEQLRELQAAAAVALIEALGGSLTAEENRLAVRLPT